MKYARRTFAIVSTISIPHPAPMSPMEAIVNPPSQGSRLDADHPQNGGLIPCRFTEGDAIGCGRALQMFKLAVLADQYRLDRRLHVVVDAARAGALEEIKGAGMRVENHLLALALIGPHERHPAVAQPDMGDFDRRRHPVQHDDLVAPVELVGFARRKAQWYIGLHRRGPARRPPNPGVAANRVIAALIAKPAQLLEDTNQRQPLARRLLLVRQQQSVELVPPRVNSRQWLPAAFIAKLRRFRADHLAHDSARQAKLAADL